MVLVGKQVFLSRICVCSYTHFLPMYVSLSLCVRSLSVLVSGALDFLERPTVVFVRLKESAVLSSALEAPMPVRFVFILVGPSSADMDYHETGRAMAALLADKVSVDPEYCVFIQMCQRTSIDLLRSNCAIDVVSEVNFRTVNVTSAISVPGLQSDRPSSEDCPRAHRCCG